MAARHAMLSLFAVFAIASLAGAETFRVTVATDGGNGVCDQTCSLREALAAANAQPEMDEILVPAGIYELSAGALRIEADVAIHGARSSESDAGNGETVVDAGGASRVFEVASGVSALLRGLTVRGGEAENGGGILNEGMLEIRESRLTENAALGTIGGPCQQVWPPRILPLCMQVGGKGGGVYNSGSLVVRDSTIDSNRAFNSGNVCQYPSGTRFPCVGLLQGGGIASDGELIVRNSTVSGNVASDDNVGFSGGSCGGILSTGELILTNATVAENRASGAGGLCSLGRVTFRNTLMALDAGQLGECDISGQVIEVVADAHNLEWSLAESLGVRLPPSCGFSGSDLLGIDPRLAPLADNGGAAPTHALMAGSLAIDGGSADPPGSGGTSCEATDQRGVPRPQGAACDIGAYEASVGGVCAGDCNDDGRVDIAELIRGIRINLGLEPLDVCRPFDINDDGIVSVAELIRAVLYVLLGCPASS